MPPCSPNWNRAYQRQAPILLWIYAPHWATAKYQGEWVEFPEIYAGVLHRPVLGRESGSGLRLRQTARAESGKLPGAGVKDKWPGAYNAIKAFNIDNNEMGQMIIKVDLERQKLEDVVAEWMDANEARWKTWIAK